jgi:photosystem II stability/assembly factor-like uncharacterized protein
MNFIKTTLGLLLSFCCYRLCAQPWIETLPPEKRNNFFEIQKAAAAYFEANPPVKGDGFKPFRRWEYYWRPRINPDGSFPNVAEHLNEWRKYRLMQNNKLNKTSNSGDWKPLGPITALNPKEGQTGIGRVNCIAFHPANNNIVYIGTPAGGLWRSSDGGRKWEPLTDTLPVLGVSDIAFNPQNPDEIYIATGDHVVGGPTTSSIGLWKSVDGGNNWKPTGLEFFVTRKISITRILIHPQKPNIILAGASDGVYRSTDSGENWGVALDGVIHDLEFHPTNPEVVYASCIIEDRGAIYKSTNGGATWVERSRGINKNAVRRIELAVTQASPNSVYAVCADARNTSFGGFYVSRDGAQNWTLQSSQPNILDFSADGSGDRGQAWYDLAIAVSPLDSNLVFVGGINVWRSTNSGRTWEVSSLWSINGGPRYAHADHHALEFAPNTNAIWSGNDGGIFLSNNGGLEWKMFNENLAITQYYKIATSEKEPFLMIGGTQDNGTHRFLDNTWLIILGGDGMDCLIDYSDPSTIYASLYNGAFFRSTSSGLFAQPIGPGEETGAWVSPIVQDPVNPSAIYIGLDNLWYSSDKGNSWRKVSAKRPFPNHKIKKIAIARNAPHIIYLAPEGENDLIKSSDGGRTFTSAVGNLPSANVNDILIHPIDPNRVWVALAGYRNRIKVFETRNGGQTWVNISGSLPNLPANCLAFQQGAKDGLYLGMDVGVYYRDSTMQDWILFNEGLPNTIINDLEINYATQSIRAGTYGRGVWESPLYSPSGVESCNRLVRFTAPSGFIEDGSGPLPYANLSDCRLLITPIGAEGRRIKLQVLELGTEEGRDFLEIYDGENIDAPILGKYSGRRLPPVTRSSGNVMLVRFTSDEQNVDAGFRAFYELETTIGAEDAWEREGIKIYPNPFEDTFIIEFVQPIAFTAKLYNMLGQLVEERLITPTLFTQIELPERLPPGVYHLQLITHKKLLSTKITKKGS